MNAKTYGQLVNGTSEAEIAVTSVQLNRAEGPCELCGRSSYTTIQEADAAIKLWAAGMPEDQLGYDKVDFKVNFSNGEFYSGRYDMKPMDRYGASLKAQMVATVRWHAENAQYVGETVAKESAAALPFYEGL